MESLQNLGNLKCCRACSNRADLLQSLVRRYLAHILVVATIAAITVGSYASVVFAPLPTTPKAVWTVDPLVISFAATATSGSETDSVACTPSAGFVQLLSKSSNPARLMLSTSSSGLICGGTSSSVTVTAMCLVPAASCRGSYSGQVQLRQAENYRNIARVLNVQITVT